ncbi:MAG: GNAT family N-acetyltransferase [Clostridium sp.]
MEIRKVENESLCTEISTKILDGLPKWFGIPESTAEYIKESSKMPFWAAYDKEKVVGFVALKQTSEHTSEIYVMGIDEGYHRNGIGKALFQCCYNYCRENGVEFLQVKTIDGASPDKNYAKTRKFYKAIGFKELECIPEIWGEYNPCLIMIMKIN